MRRTELFRNRFPCAGLASAALVGGGAEVLGLAGEAEELFMPAIGATEAGEAAANEQERAQVAQLAQQLQTVTRQSVEVAFVDQGYTGAEVAAAAAQEGIRLEAVKLQEAKRGFVLLPRRWVVERSFAWSARFRRLARDYERLAPTFAGFHWLAFACLLLRPLFP